MSKPSYRPIWEKRFQEHRESAIRVSRWDPFEGWEGDTAPDWRAEDYLRFALEVLYGRGDIDLALRFLEQCLAIVQRALAENKVQAPWCRDKFPENRGSLLRTRSYAEALLGRPLDQAALLAASADYESACAGYPKRKWDDFQEAKYLEAVRLALLSSSAETAQRLLYRRRAFPWHVQEHRLLQAFQGALTAGVPRWDAGFLSCFDAYFDQVRDPGYKPVEWSRVPILRLELGLLRDKFLISPDGRIDWQRAIDAIAE